MNQTKKVKIVSSACYLPKKVSSKQLEDQYNLPKGWSEKYSGVANRHHVTFESNGYMGARAIEAALENSNLQLSDIDLIISAGATFDYPLPNQSSIIKSELKEGLKYNTPTIDIDTTCLSFVTSFDIASKMMDNYQYKNIIIVASEIGSNGLNPNNPETLTLFGDAAVAVILSCDKNSESFFVKGAMKTYT
jgi:3-oxoacyl-[acyl-carrier-protein] synthase-3